ncbi:MAG TPA: tetratricopeptide repeat protein, partial [Acidobacteriota bacterium]|nr:tetratricopeptide repeat protein [Acidobacteriota bacterium]
PADPERHRIAAQSYLRAGRYIEGIGTYRQARVDLADSLAFAEDLARLLEARREYEAAVGEYFRWLAAAPKASNTVQKQITNLIKIPEAAPQITAALHTTVLGSPENEYAHRLYGDLLFESGEVDSAFAEYRRADALAAAPGAHRLSGINRCLETGNMRTARDEAAAFLVDYLEHPRRADVHIALAKAELGLNRPEVAIDLLRRLSEQIPHPRERARIDYQIGDIYRLYTGQMDSARVLFERVIDVASRGTAERTRALLRLADIAVYYGDLVAADSACQRAAAAAPNNLREEVSFYRAVLLFLSGAYSESAAELKDLVKQFPKGLYVNDAIALSLIVRDGNDAMGWSLDRYAAAQLALRRGRPDSALALFTILAADSVNALADDAQFAAAGVHADAGDFEAALTSYQAVITLFPESPLVPQAWMAIGDLYADKLGDGTAARSAYQTVISDFKESPVVETARHHLQRMGVP